MRNSLIMTNTLQIHRTIHLFADLLLSAASFIQIRCTSECAGGYASARKPRRCGAEGRSANRLEEDSSAKGERPGSSLVGAEEIGTTDGERTRERMVRPRLIPLGYERANEAFPQSFTSRATDHTVEKDARSHSPVRVLRARTFMLSFVHETS